MVDNKLDIDFAYVTKINRKEKEIQLKELKTVFRKLIEEGDWSPKGNIKCTAREVANVVIKYKSISNTLYLDALWLADMRHGQRVHMLHGLDLLKLNLYHLIASLENELENELK